MDEKIDLILLKLKELRTEVDEIKQLVESHRVEHGFQKMQDGGINANFGGDQQQPPQGPPTGMPPGMGGGGFGQGAGYQMPGQGMPMRQPMQDPTRPPGM